MAEETIKLFAKMSERLPQPDDAEQLGQTATEALKKVPVVGDIATYILSLFFNPFQERRDDWFRELADGLEELQSKVEGFDVENLAKDDAFVSAMVQATRIAIGTHQREKRRCLRNALLNIAKGKGPDETKQQIFLNAIEYFTPTHVQALDLMWRGAGRQISWDKNAVGMGQRNYGTALGILVPEIAGQPSLLSAIFADLRNRGFSNLGGPEQLFPQGGIITNLGIEFLCFVLDPEHLQK